ncbi:hypothetical protein ACA910_020464 [Epithemia clementina (nom. ined.)]
MDNRIVHMDFNDDEDDATYQPEEESSDDDEMDAALYDSGHKAIDEQDVIPGGDPDNFMENTGVEDQHENDEDPYPDVEPDESTGAEAQPEAIEGNHPDDHSNNAMDQPLENT